MITIDDFKANTKEWLIDKLGDMSLDDALQTISNLYNELHKPKYPKTFEECLNVLYCKSVLRTIIGHKAELLFNLEKLLICRDAYWKIAGEQMGLGKPWEPDWYTKELKYIIYCENNKIWFNDEISRNTILVFPTLEMRDAFYENFKDLMEQCKELL